MSQICEAGLASSLEDAKRQDIAMCQRILGMRAFAQLSEIEKSNPKSLTEEQRRFILQCEKDAGLILKG